MKFSFDGTDSHIRWRKNRLMNTSEWRMFRSSVVHSEIEYRSFASNKNRNTKNKNRRLFLYKRKRRRRKYISRRTTAINETKYMYIYRERELDILIQTSEHFLTGICHVEKSIVILKRITIAQKKEMNFTWLI